MLVMTCSQLTSWLADADRAGRELAAVQVKRQTVEQSLDTHQLTPTRCAVCFCVAAAATDCFWLVC
jgi:hypothetical protein